MFATYNLGGSKSNLFVTLTVSRLELQGTDAVLELLDCCLEFLNRRALAFGFNFPRLVLFLELGLELGGSLQALLELLFRKLGLAISDPLLVVLLELLGNLGAFSLDEELVMLQDPGLVNVFVEIEVLGSLLLLLFGIDIQHHHLGPPALVSQSLDAIPKLLHLGLVGCADCPLVVA